MCRTSGAGPVLARGHAGTAEAHVIESQHSEAVVDVRRELQVSRGLGPRNLSQIVPDAVLVECVLILDQEL